MIHPAYKEKFKIAQAERRIMEQRDKNYQAVEGHKMIQVRIDDILNEWKNAFFNIYDNNYALLTADIWKMMETQYKIKVIGAPTRADAIEFENKEDLLFFKLRWSK